MDKIIYKSIERIRPDPNQPRKHLNNKKIKEIAVSIKNEGVINPIEIDKDGVIITGELRYRASKIAGLGTIPCRVIDIGTGRRFIRQMQENIHHNTLNAIDIGEGLKKTIEILKKESLEAKIIYKTLSDLYGRSEFWIYDHLKLLKEPTRIKQAVLRGFGIARVREKNKIPKEFRKEFENKILKQRYISLLGLREISNGIRRATVFNNKKAIKQLLSNNYKDRGDQPLSSKETIQRVRELSPDVASIIESDIERTRAIAKKISELEKLLNENPLSSLKETFSKQSLIFQIKTLFAVTQKYLSGHNLVPKIQQAKQNIKLLKQ